MKRPKKHKWAELQVCASRHCSNEFTPKRKAQRFCSARCRNDTHYGWNRTSKKPRRRHLRAASDPSRSRVLRSGENQQEGAAKTVGCKRTFGAAELVDAIIRAEAAP